MNSNLGARDWRRAARVKCLSEEIEVRCVLGTVSGPGEGREDKERSGEYLILTLQIGQFLSQEFVLRLCFLVIPLDVLPGRGR